MNIKIELKDGTTLSFEDVEMNSDRELASKMIYDYLEKYLTVEVEKRVNLQNLREELR